MTEEEKKRLEERLTRLEERLSKLESRLGLPRINSRPSPYDAGVRRIKRK